jgi:23S rRNA pseudouridine955/2504/2580 synthase
MTASSPTSPGVRQVEIDESSDGQRLDNFLLKTLKGVPKSMIYRIVRQGEVRVNRRRARPDQRLQAGDVVRIPPVRTAAAAPVPRKGADYGWIEGRVLYEDADLLVIDKPSGMAVHGGSGISLGLIEALRLLRPNAPMLELVHRLDRETSGCLIIAKRRSVLRALHQALREGKTDKRYLALIKGEWQGRGRRIEVALAKNQLQSGERVVRADDEGKLSISKVTPQRNFPPREQLPEGAALVAIDLLTGRTHQARVHMAHIGQAIGGDSKYGDKEFNRHLQQLGLRRLFLHASRIRFTHPRKACKIEISAPLPGDLESVLEQLKS